MHVVIHWWLGWVELDCIFYITKFRCLVRRMWTEKFLTPGQKLLLNTPRSFLRSQRYLKVENLYLIYFRDSPQSTWKSPHIANALNASCSSLWGSLRAILTRLELRCTCIYGQCSRHDLINIANFPSCIPQSDTIRRVRIFASFISGVIGTVSRRCRRSGQRPS